MSCFFFALDCDIITVAVDEPKEAIGVGEDEWYTADEGVFDERVGRYVSSPAYLECLGMKEREKKSISDDKEEVKSSTKLELQFDLHEVYNTCFEQMMPLKPLFGILKGVLTQCNDVWDKKGRGDRVSFRNFFKGGQKLGQPIRGGASDLSYRIIIW